MSLKDDEIQESRDEVADKTDLKTLDKLDLQLPISKLSLVNLVPLANRRKFSFPASLHSNLINNLSNEHSAAKRRFSNVGDVVSRYYHFFCRLFYLVM